MRIKFLLIIACMTSLSLTAQNLKYLETDIVYTVITDLDSFKMKAERIFQIDPFNEVATFCLTNSYKYNNHDSLIPEFFRKLISENPGNPKPYLLSAKCQHPEISLEDTLRLGDLKKAYELDPQNFEANYLLGVSYYELFHEAVSKNLNNSKYFASKANQYFIAVTQIESSSIEYTKYLIIQLSEFLGDKEIIVKYSQIPVLPKVSKDNIPLEGQFFFPFDTFLELDDDWQTNYKTDVLRAVDLAKFHLDWYTDELEALQEPLLFNLPQDTVYRFLWLRTYDPSVAISIQKKNERIILIWKMADVNIFSEKLIVNAQKELTLDDWKSFRKFLNQCDFWNMSTQINLLGVDGSRWVIEGVENGKYHVVDRWSPHNLRI